MSAQQPPPPPPPGPPGPPTPPPGGYGTPPPAGSAPWDVGSAVSYSWTKFQQNVGQIIVAALAMVIGIIVIAVIGFVIVGAVTSTATVDCGYDAFGNYDCETEGGTPFIVSMILFLLVYFVIFLFSQIIGAGLIRGALGITDGRPFQASEVFKFDKIGPVLITSLIVGAATFVGLILCYIPGLIIMFATSYSLYFVLDRNLAPTDAIKASVDLVRNNLGPTLIWYIVGGLIASAGAIVCGIGLLVTLPILLIGTAFTYKKLTGQPVAP